MSDPSTVKTIRPHDTVGGMRQPGERYVRDDESAKALAALGVVSIVTAKAKAAK